jgi:hypothetical protein
MNLNKVIEELKTELACLDEALVVLDRLARGRVKRRGRPPLYLIHTAGAADGAKRRRPFSEETKRKMAAAQKRRWAAYRKAKKQQSSASE